MNNYSYSPSISFGQFIPKETLLHRLDPRIKVFLSLVVILSASLTLSFITLSIVFGFILIGAFVSKMTWRQIFKAIYKVLPYLFIISILQFLFAFTEDVRILFILFDRIVISVEDLIHLGILLYRFLVLLIGIQFITSFTSISQFTNGLEHLFRPLTYIKIPVSDMVMVVQIALRFTPSIFTTMNSITRAQASRGANIQPMGQGNLVQRVRQLIPLLVPMFVSSLKQSERIALAMDARAYGIEIRRTSLHPMKFQIADWIVLGIALFIMIVPLLFNF